MSIPVLYIPYRKFVAVATPHARKQVLSRAGDSFTKFLKDCEIDLEALFEKANAGTCYAVTVGSGKRTFFLYIKRRFNAKRRRHELECITLTPSRHVTTAKHKFAKLLQ